MRDIVNTVAELGDNGVRLMLLNLGLDTAPVKAG